jgi:hypothetical protein
MRSRGANPRLVARPTVALGFRVPVEVAEQMRRLVARHNCSISHLFALSLDAFEAQTRNGDGSAGGPLAAALDLVGEGA